MCVLVDPNWVNPPEEKDRIDVSQLPIQKQTHTIERIIQLVWTDLHFDIPLLQRQNIVRLVLAENARIQ